MMKSHVEPTVMDKSCFTITSLLVILLTNL